MKTTTLMLSGLAALVGYTTGHGAMTFPKPRNAIDGKLPVFKSWGYPCDATHQGDNCSITFCDGKTSCQAACPKSAHNGNVDALTADNGLSCYWYSIGCTIGCDECDSWTNHPGHGEQRFLYNGVHQEDLPKNVTINPWDPGVDVITLDPASIKGLNITSPCAITPHTHTPTICDPRLRTMNVHAECGSPLDIYYWSPWRAPGRAPVIDACGVAGGRRPGQGNGHNYMNTSLSKSGDFGSKLPAMPSQETWKAGMVYEAGWTVSAHHGGGYAYRIAPADGPLTEEAFRKTPLDFVGNSILRWGGNKSSQLEFDSKGKGWQTNVGTVPAGSMWRKFPLPTLRWSREGPSFEPVCEESDACKDYARDGRGPVAVCKCSGYYRALVRGVANVGPLLPNIEIVDRLRVPADLAPGKYVLQWRWDCEETAQIWSSCADITVV